ncbi:hypothetical protein J1N35_041214 [Gossypium stocksii]|uniref:Uncharacterized protein n=1 Tax=Gossypium stocksii TaxID=47602 RepID=A0A9D3UF25_9ROSI|nr:hypothetical protein J1N35_041214 [Gossypium stocksii]
MFNTEDTFWGMVATSSGWQSTCHFGRSDMYMRKDDVLHKKPTVEGTSNMADVGGSENKYGLKVALFSKLKSIPIELEDGEGLKMKKKKRMGWSLQNEHIGGLAMQVLLMIQVNWKWAWSFLVKILAAVKR